MTFNVILWIVATIVTEWALKSIWRDYIEPLYLARGQAKLDAEQAGEPQWHELRRDHRTIAQRHADEVQRRRVEIEHISIMAAARLDYLTDARRAAILRGSDSS